MSQDEDDHDIIVQFSRPWEQADADQARLEQLVRTVCRQFGLTTATVSIVLVGDEAFRQLNRQFLNHDTISDCLSFDLSDSADQKEDRLFELIINAELAARQAQQRGHTINAETALYVTHALLHQLGFDDDTKTHAKKMHETEDKILQELGYGLVYNSEQKHAR